MPQPPRLNRNPHSGSAAPRLARLPVRPVHSAHVPILGMGLPGSALPLAWGSNPTARMKVPGAGVGHEF